MPWSNQSGGGWRGGSGGPWGSPPPGNSQPPDLEELLRRSQDRLRNILPGGGFGGRGILLAILAVLVLWGASGFYRVNPNELGVELRFGRFEGTYKQPGLRYHLPWPIETALTPQVTTRNRIQIGVSSVELNRPSSLRDSSPDSLMLTGDENIVDINFSVFWVIKDAAAYLFNIQNPAGSVTAVAESAMREVIGRSDIEPILTGARARTETAVQELIQQALDDYGAGIQITQVQLQKVDPPAQVIDAFRDVQAARADQERLQNQADTYANQVVPEARGQAATIVQSAQADRERSIAEARGQAERFVKVYDEYSKAPDITRQRIYLETMEQVFQDVDKVIIDEAARSGVVPYLPLGHLNPATRSPRPQQQQSGGQSR